MRKLTFDIEKFKELYEQGLNDQQIAQELKCKDGAIQSYRKRNNLPTKFVYNSILDDRLEEIKELKKQGLGNRKIANQLNISRDNLLYLFRHNHTFIYIYR